MTLLQMRPPDSETSDFLMILNQEIRAVARVRGICNQCLSRNSSRKLPSSHHRGLTPGSRASTQRSRRSSMAGLSRYFGRLRVVSGRVVQMCVKSCKDLRRVTSRTPRGEGDTSANSTGRLPFFWADMSCFRAENLNLPPFASLRAPLIPAIALTCEDIIKSTKASIWQQEQRQVQQWRQQTLM